MPEPREPPLRALLDRIREDAPITRRDYLRILVTISGGLLVGTGAVAAGAFVRHGVGHAPPRRIAGALPAGESMYFDYPAADDQAIAVRLPSGRLVGYSAICTHLSCSVIWNRKAGRLDCPCHNGAYDAGTGRVLFGPPPRPLPEVVLQERADGIWAVGTVGSGR